MRITRLTLAGFGPYKNEQFVDFDRFADDGIFLITGKTGAGKSSILDAICYALYASVPRYDQTQQHLRSDHCDVDDPTFVELEFTINGVSYRVRRSPEFERPKQRGTGTTKQAATAELSENTGEGWRGLSARAVDVGRDLDRILGLSKDQFLQVILLAQNRFQKFLKSSNDERQSVLRTLFGTRRFERIESMLTERRKALEAQLDAINTSLRQRAEQAAALLDDADVPAHPVPEWFGELRVTLDAQLAVASASASTADAAATAAELEHRRLVDTRRLQDRRAAGEMALQTLAAQQSAIDAERSVLADAQRAALVGVFITARREADLALHTAMDREAGARDRYQRFDGADISRGADVPTGAEVLAGISSSAALDTTIDSITRSLGALADVATDEKRLPVLAADVDRAADRLAQRDREFATATERVAALPTQIAELAEAAVETRLEAARRPDAEAAVTRLGAALRSAQQAVVLGTELSAAEVAERDASTTHTAAALRLDALLEQRLSGHAGELALALVDGAPCLVCGSTTHPAPATTDGEPVTEPRIRAARAEVTTARATMDAAHTVVQSIHTHLTEARTRADGKAVAELELELAASSDALQRAHSARVLSESQEAEQAALRSQLEAATTTLGGLAELRSTAEKGLAEAELIVTTVSARVEQNLAGFPSIAARVEHLRAHLIAARTFADAIAQAQMARSTQTAAAASLHTQLGEHRFASEADAVAALRPAPEVSALDRRLREFDQAISTARATIADAELADLPAEPVSADGAAAALTAARTARDEALRVQNSVAERATRLATITAAALAEMASTEQSRHEYAQLRQLANAVQGLEPNTKRMRLETFVLAAQLEEIVAAANARLRTMTSGRFVLEHNDGLQYRNTQSGLGLSILDQHTGRSRATHSLSGGETFLASLALALGLAEVVTNQTGGITLDTLFIDEGFGSLDGETLETAMSTLDSLRAGGRTIGLISHVDTMKEQIPAKLRIVVTDRGYSEIQTSVDLE
jgi:exonuclease SbcC